jgi:hypothetical protein
MALVPSVGTHNAGAPFGARGEQYIDAYVAVYMLLTSS